MRYSLALYFLITTFTTQAQRFDRVIENTDAEELFRLATSFKHGFQEDSLRAAKFLSDNNLPKIETGENGYIKELVGITEDGEFIYFETDNSQSAETIGTDKVRLPGPVGYNVNGDGLKVGVWDGGRVRNTHQEFGTRVVQRDNATNNSGHATHVSGTVGASGVRTDAKGMAPLVGIDAYDWGANTTEMSFAASAGLLVSNHSYGTVTGWTQNGNNWVWTGNANVSATEDYRFGFYGSTASSFDQIAFTAPYFLIVKSAGNDRNQGPNSAGTNGQANRDPDYGSVSSASMAKNILVVGAVEGINGGYLSPAQVQMTNFSCWGPTDDGRIRPDVVAKGRAVLSTWASSNTAYQSNQGTSMASPAVAGSAILLQEHYENEHGTGSFMRSASLKGLIIHTADEAGTSDGPDYRFGWGLMNTKKAADLISDPNAYILEKQLSSGNTERMKVVVDQTGDVRITLSWTDPAANALPASLNPSTLVLENDLDVRLKSTTSSLEYKPYILNPAIPQAPASTGDNFRDNVEHIYAQNVPAGVYTLEISHKKTSLVNGIQEYSLILEGLGILPKVSFNLSKETICLGESVSLIGGGSDDVTRFEWKSIGGQLNISNPSAKNTTAIAQLPGSYKLRLVAYNSRGKDSVEVNNALIVHPNPLVSIDTSGIYCLPDFGVKSIKANIPGGTWNGGTWMPFTDTVLFVPSNVGPGDYSLRYTATDINGCVGRDTTIVRLRQGPVASLDSLPLYYRLDSDSLLTGGLPLGGSYYINDSLDSLIRPSILGSGFHKINYVLLDSNGCESIAEAFIELAVTTGIHSAGKSELALSPNPFSRDIHLSREQGIGALRIQDPRGRVVYSATFEGPHAIINLDYLMSGVYFLCTENGKSFKIIKTE